jgi:hypothetical protein
MRTPRLPVVDWTDGASVQSTTGRFEWTLPFRRMTKSGFCACIITFQLASTLTYISEQFTFASTQRDFVVSCYYDSFLRKRALDIFALSNWQTRSKHIEAVHWHEVVLCNKCFVCLLMCVLVHVLPAWWWKVLKIWLDLCAVNRLGKFLKCDFFYVRSTDLTHFEECDLNVTLLMCG